MSDRPPFLLPLPKKGKYSLFSIPPSLCIGDPFKDPQVPRRRFTKNDDRPSFRPGGAIQYHEDDTEISQKPSLKLSYAELKARKEKPLLRSFVVAPARPFFSPWPVSIPDDYESAKKLKTEARKAEIAKYSELPPFRPSGVCRVVEAVADEVEVEKEVREKSDSKIVSEDRPAFRPPGGFILGKFPEYIGEGGVKNLIKKKVEKTTEDIPPWRGPPVMQNSKNSPSVIFNMTNIRKNNPTIFRT